MLIGQADLPANKVQRSDGTCAGISPANSYPIATFVYVYIAVYFHVDLSFRFIGFDVQPYSCPAAVARGLATDQPVLMFGLPGCNLGYPIS
ncbi:hypothetical protein D3C87_1630890 [compost metagenome]